MTHGKFDIDIRKFLFNTAIEQAAKEAGTKVCALRIRHAWELIGANTGMAGVAAQVRGVACVCDDDILTTFFTSEAVDLLAQLPNRYWFWKVVEQCAVRSTAMPVTPDDVRRAMRKAAPDGMNDVWRFVAKPIEELAAAEAGMLVAFGALVTAWKDYSPTLLKNPVFYGLAETSGK